MAQDIQAFRVGGHHAVLDAVVNHLNEVACAARTAVKVAMFGGTTQLFPPGRARSLLNAWREGSENGIAAPNDCFITADHQTVAAL